MSKLSVNLNRTKKVDARTFQLWVCMLAKFEDVLSSSSVLRMADTLIYAISRYKSGRTSVGFQAFFLSRGVSAAASYMKKLFCGTPRNKTTVSFPTVLYTSILPYIQVVLNLIAAFISIIKPGRTMQIFIRLWSEPPSISAGVVMNVV